MKRRFRQRIHVISMLLFAPSFLMGCSTLSDQSISLSTVYGMVALLSVLMLAAQWFLLKKKNRYLLLLFLSVVVVNTGYFSLSVSTTLRNALHANRISYLGSVFLPVSMLLTTLDAVGIRYRKRLPIALLCTGVAMFLIAGSPGYLDIYYADVSLAFVDGVAMLKKVYGPCHQLYLYYLLLYFFATMGVTVYSILKKNLVSRVQAVILVFAMLVNIGVWLIEQLVELPFEMLSISYLISELFLLGLFMMQQENPPQIPAAAPSAPAVQILPPDGAPLADPAPPAAPSPAFLEQCEQFQRGLGELTPTETLVYRLYTEGKGTREVLEALNIKENTLKFHNKNLYAKLGISSRKQLLEFAAALEQRHGAQ